MVRAARLVLHLSLRDVAAAIGKSYGYIHDLELGRRNATPEVLRDLAAHLKLDPADMIRAANAERIATLEKKIAELREEA